MSEMRQVPVNLSHENLLAVLDDIRARVAEGDSLEGHIEWLMPEDPDAPARSFDVRSSYRVGNREGQGGMRVIGEWREVPPDACPCCTGLHSDDCNCRDDCGVTQCQAADPEGPNCHFREPGKGCHFEALIPGLESCSDCPDLVS